MTPNATSTQPEQTVQITVRFPISKHESFRRIAFDAKRSMNEIILTALDGYLPELESAMAAGAPSLQESPVAAKG